MNTISRFLVVGVSALALGACSYEVVAVFGSPPASDASSPDSGFLPGEKDAGFDSASDSSRDVGPDAVDSAPFCNVYGQLDDAEGDPGICPDPGLPYAYRCTKSPDPSCRPERDTDWCCPKKICVPYPIEWCPKPWKSYACHLEGEVPEECYVLESPGPTCCPDGVVPGES